MGLDGFVPARFLTLTAHLVITLTIFQDRNENVLSCLPLQYTEREYDDKDQELIAALSLSLVGFAVEFFGFLSGISTFNASCALLSIVTHTSASVASAFFVWDIWPCDYYWFLFGFCSAMPALAEIVILIGIFGCKKSL